MKKIVFLSLSLFLIINTANFAQQAKYEPNWESLDKRPVAPWFGEAKFGIFIHWGPYSVPAWSPKGTYSEWYQYWMQTKALFGNGKFKGDEVTQFHNKTYGPHFSYYQFGDMFKADLFKPDDWAALFEEAGAKYVVLTTKHHDGYTLWPSKEANDRGFPWNSVEVGSGRDLVGELTTSVKNAGIKMGFYYSLYEWFHPWWQNDRDKFVTEHYHPQFKDLVESYQPDIMWGDGEWEMPSEKWKSAELMAWLFNESSVKNDVVINDRWGKEIRKNHGGYFTTEYESASPKFQKPWEECRGMGFSFGYNQNEDAQDYNSPKALTLMLINIVSTGGNLLLDIGPDARGRIPTIMQERLKQIGAWLGKNGEAIYGTKTWNDSFQWSLKGERDFKPKQHYLGGDFILKQTVDPEPGYGVKELFFTQNESSFFAISPQWPGSSMTIRKFKPAKDAQVTLLATGEKLKWRTEGKDMIVDLPGFDPNKFDQEDYYAWAFKISK